MAITFDPTNKIVQLDSTSVSAATIWSRWVDYVVLSDNSKYGAVMTQLGGVAPVDLYIFMENGWLVRPLEADGITTITGNLLVAGGGSPIAQTLGNFNVLVNLETPVKASAINSGSSLTPLQQSQLAELWTLAGLDAANAMTVSSTARTAGAVDLGIASNVDGSVTVTRN